MVFINNLILAYFSYGNCISTGAAVHVKAEACGSPCDHLRSSATQLCHKQAIELQGAQDFSELAALLPPLSFLQSLPPSLLVFCVRCHPFPQFSALAAPLPLCFYALVAFLPLSSCFLFFCTSALFCTRCPLLPLLREEGGQRGQKLKGKGGNQQGRGKGDRKCQNRGGGKACAK